MTKTRNLFVLAILGFLLWQLLPLLPKLGTQKELPRGNYVLQADWDAIQATITYSVSDFHPSPITVDAEHWQAIVKAKPGDLLTVMAKPHLPGKKFKTNCFIRDYKWRIMAQDHAAWNENDGVVLCSYIAK